MWTLDDTEMGETHGRDPAHMLAPAVIPSEFPWESGTQEGTTKNGVLEGPRLAAQGRHLHGNLRKGHAELGDEGLIVPRIESDGCHVVAREDWVAGQGELPQKLKEVVV